MAYKFQKGSAILSGALIQDSNVTAEGNVTGTGISVDGSSLSAGDNIEINAGNILINGTNNHGANIYAGTAHKLAELTASVHTGGKHVQMRVRNATGTTVLKAGSVMIAGTEGELGQGFLQQMSSGGAVKANLSGSGDGMVDSLTFQGNLDVMGDLTVTGNLTVDGTLTTIDTTTLKIEDDIAHVASGADSEATSVDSGFQVGTDTSANKVGQILLKDSSADADVDNASVVYFALCGNTTAATDLVSVEADKFFGDGSGLTGLSGAPSYTVHPKSNGQTLAEGLNYVTGAASSHTLTLPAASGLSLGAFFKVKSLDNHNSTNKITINRSASDTIDGVNSIDLENAFSAITIIKTGTSTFSII